MKEGHNGNSYTITLMGIIMAIKQKPRHVNQIPTVLVAQRASSYKRKRKIVLNYIREIETHHAVWVSIDRCIKNIAIAKLRNLRGSLQFKLRLTKWDCAPSSTTASEGYIALFCEQAMMCPQTVNA